MPPTLSPRQAEVLHHASCGLCNKDIARELGISVGAVKVHKIYLRRKLGDDGYMHAIYRNAPAAAGSAPADVYSNWRDS